MNYENFTLLAQNALKKATTIAKESQHKKIENGHILQGILEIDKNICPFILRKLDIDLPEFEKQIQTIVTNYPKLETNAKLEIASTVEDALNKAFALSKQLADEFVSIEHILTGIILSTDAVGQLFNKKFANPEKMKKIIDELRNGTEIKQQKTNNLENLNKFARNINILVKQNKIDPVIGRSEEIRRILQILSRRHKNNPMIIGEPGVGKTAVIEGLTQRIVKGDVPDNLKNIQIFALDFASLIAGASKQGEFEERLKNLLRELQEAAGEIILFLDEIHLIMGAGKSAGLDAANILKPALARGELKIIGATTVSEYKKHLEKDKAFIRRFQNIMIHEPSVADSISILRGLKEKFENHHKVQIKDDALIAAAELSHRYIAERFLPDKAIDLIDETAAKLRLEMSTIPEEIDEIERKLTQLKVEKELLKKEDDTDKILILRTQISELSEKRTVMRATWENQKLLIEDIIKQKEKIDLLKNTEQQAEEQGNYQKAAELKYATIIEEKNKLNELITKLNASNSEALLLKESVDKDLIAEMVSSWTGIPVNKMLQSEKDKLIKLEDHLSRRVIGQKDAITAIANSIRRNRAGLSDENRPIGSFIFLGTTGVGKTELAKALAEFLFDDDKAITRIDMSEYQEQHAVSKLIGSPPGYVGFEDGGQLTEALRNKPYTVVLLDEIEKAHKDIFNTFLQVLDDGHLTDSKGVTVSFKNAIIVMTSNAGADKIMDNFKKMTKENAAEMINKSKADVSEALKKIMPPEFINRIDELIMFAPLSYSDIRKIVELQINTLKRKLLKKNIQLELSRNAISWLAKMSYNPQFGARPVKRAIQRNILNELSVNILKNTISNDKIVYINYLDKLVFENITNEQLQEKRKEEEKTTDNIEKSEIKNTEQTELQNTKTAENTINKEQENSRWKRFLTWLKNIFNSKK